MFCICVLIIAAAAVYMVEAYIHTYYAIEYMHGAPLFFVLLAKYAAPVLFLLLFGYFVFRYREKRRESEKPTQDKPENREEVYAEKINATVKTKAVFSDHADQMLYQVMRFGQKMAVAYSMTQDSKTSGEQAKCLTLLASAERIFYDRLDDAIRSASMFDETEYKAFQQGIISFGDTDTAKKKQEIYNNRIGVTDGESEHYFYFTVQGKDEDILLALNVMLNVIYTSAEGKCRKETGTSFAELPLMQRFDAITRYIEDEFETCLMMLSDIPYMQWT